MPYLPNEAAQRATNYGWMNPTHRRSHHTILVNLLQNPWYGILCPIGKSSVKYMALVAMEVIIVSLKSQHCQYNYTV